MKVLQINSVCGVGSTGRIATDVYDVLENNGHDCLIAYGRGKSPKNYKTIKIGNKYDFYKHVLKTRLFDLHGLGSKKSTENLINSISMYKPDVIFLHNIHGYFINIKVLFEYFAETRIPIVWLLHDAWPISGHSAHFELDKNGRIPEQNSNRLQKFEYPKSYLFDNSRKNYQIKKRLFTNLNDITIITPSYWLANMMEKSFLSKYHIETIHNGIDLEKFKFIPNQFKEQHNIIGKKVILGVASIWNDKKGLNHFNKLSDELGEDYQVVLVGINRKIKKKLSNNIIGIEKTNSIEELAEIYSAADIFVNPTLEDNFPTTNIESLACGTPVITFDTGGSKESLSKDTGIVIEKNNYDKLYQSIINFDYSMDYNTYCRKQALKFEKNKVYKQYLSIFSELISN